MGNPKETTCKICGQVIRFGDKKSHWETIFDYGYGEEISVLIGEDVRLGITVEERQRITDEILGRLEVP